MTEFIIKKLPYDLSSNAGLALVGKYLKRININALVDPKFPVRAGVANSDILKCYLALLCLGKNDFDAVEAFRGDEFARLALGLGGAPSSPTLRQRLDARASDWFELAAGINNRLLNLRIGGKDIDFGRLACGYTPIDLDTFVMNNDNTSKELVGRTYAGVDGYCPLAVYLGTQGYCLELALRPGTQHSVNESEHNLQRVLPMATKLTASALLLRADSGFAPPKTSHGDRSRKTSANWPGAIIQTDPNGQVFDNPHGWNNCAYAVEFPIREPQGVLCRFWNP